MIKAFQFTGQFTHHAQVIRQHVSYHIKDLHYLKKKCVISHSPSKGYLHLEGLFFSRISQIKLLYLLSYLSPQSFLPIFPTHFIRDMIIANRTSCPTFHSVIIVISYQIVFPLISRGQQIELNSLQSKLL